MTLASPETKFGIKIQSRKRPRTLEQNFSVIAGLAYLVGGIAGFWVTGLSPVTDYLHLVTAVATLIIGTGLLRMLTGRRVADTA